MICLTGDIHHRSLRTNDQRYIADPRDSEVKIAARFARLAEQHGLKMTLYVTGKTLAEEWDDVRPILESPRVEIGGHTYAGLPQRPLTKLWYRLRGIHPPSHAGRHGSRRSQRRDIRRTIDIIHRKTGRPVVAWRSHGLVRDEHTYGLLAECGIRLISDEIRARDFFPRRTPEGLLSHPMNVLPDHDHLYHAHRDEAFVRAAQARGYGADEFGCESYTIDRWTKLVVDQIVRIEQQGGVATVLMHPICQFLADEFRTAEKLLETFARYPTVWASELLDFAKERSW
ncbi:MAG: polysaccharide deacetylase family protein [Pirellulales bacterium]|nr:polysaccharide deacetylase family protein [Pirellulales bacterium]